MQGVGFGSSLLPDAVIGNRFRLVRKLGAGAMGSVWVARHLTLGVDVAVKFIDDSLLFRPEVRTRFAQEAMAAAKIRGRHVVGILDYGADEGQQPYIAMELLHGEDLAARMERGPLGLREITTIVTQTCKGLAKAHAAGIIHRDIKPENLFLVKDEDEDDLVVKILDFGVAKADLLGLNRTETGVLVGTPVYMSPEQARGRHVDLRSDLYSLATVAYHALAGRPPFDDNNIARLVLAITTQPPAPIRALRPDLPASLDRWFARALDKEPEGRFQTARELADALSGAQIADATSRAAQDFVEWSSATMKVADLIAVQAQRESSLAVTLPADKATGEAGAAVPDDAMARARSHPLAAGLQSAQEAPAPDSVTTYVMDRPPVEPDMSTTIDDHAEQTATVEELKRARALLQEGGEPATVRAPPMVEPNIDAVERSPDGAVRVAPYPLPVRAMGPVSPDGSAPGEHAGTANPRDARSVVVRWVAVGSLLVIVVGVLVAWVVRHVGFR
jgi:serine/threonine-protein kinase